MEVTRSNFESLFPEIREDIQSAEFICIDGEFTGLQNGNDAMAFDTPEDYYLKIKAGSIDFLFIQFGLSIFIEDETTGKYRNKTYVFYLFPWHQNNLAPDRRFLCQTSSINFLVTNNFDFNKLFKEGIPYLNLSEESNFADALETRRNHQANNSYSSPAVPVPKQHKATVENAMKMIDKVVQKEKNDVKLEKQPAFIRKLIYQAYEQRYGAVEDVTLRSEGNEMVCRRGENPVERDAKRLEMAVGFSRVIREISAKGCLVVGHNMLLDLCHLVHRFMDPLPSDYLSFKEMLHTLFPRLVDTKRISSEENIKEIVGSTTLKSLDEAISKPPFHPPEIEPVEGYSYADGGQLHDAGYDSFLTGKVFIALIRAIDPDNKTSRIRNCKPLEKYINKLVLMKAPDTCIDLVNPDPQPNRDHMFHLTFPSSWTGADISKTFSCYGPIQVYWLSDTTAWVSLLEKEQAKCVLKGSFPITVTPYHRFISQSRAPKRPASEEPASGKKRKKAERNPNQEETPKQAKSKESEIEELESALSLSSGAFDTNTSWD